MKKNAANDPNDDNEATWTNEKASWPYFVAWFGWKQKRASLIHGVFVRSQKKKV